MWSRFATILTKALFRPWRRQMNHTFGWGFRPPGPHEKGHFGGGEIRGHAPVPCTQHYSPDGSMRFPVAAFGWGLGLPASGPPQGGSIFLLTADGFRGRVEPTMLGERPSCLFRVRARPDGPKPKAQTAESGGRFIIFIHRVKWRHGICGHDTFTILRVNLAYCVQIMGEDLPCYSSKI